MSSVGPQLPSSVSEKRKRQSDSHSDDSSGSDSDTGPALPSPNGISSKKPRVIGPSLPPPSSIQQGPTQPETNISVREGSESNADGNDSDEDNSDSDDDFGPSLPPSEPSGRQPYGHDITSPAQEATADSMKSSKRDDWMMVPPTGGDWSARIDPTKLKNRKFNTGKGAKGPAASDNAVSTWHETPAEKQARLQREMMGVKENTNVTTPIRTEISDKYDAQTAKRMAEYNKSRGPTLYDAHQSNQTEKDDDPSARAFDREKDIGGGLQINATKRKEMLKTASNLGSRFANAKYL